MCKWDIKSEFMATGDLRVETLEKKLWKFEWWVTMNNISNHIIASNEITDQTAMVQGVQFRSPQALLIAQFTIAR